MAINHRCRYYELEEHENKAIGGRSFDDGESTFVHLCKHLRNLGLHPNAVTNKTCDINHDFCPHNPKHQNPAT